MDIGSAVGRALGISGAQFADLHRWRTSGHFDDDERLVLALADAMAASPVEVTDELRDGVASRFGPAGLAELASAIAWEHHRARLNRALGVRAAGFSDGDACALPAHLSEG